MPDRTAERLFSQFLESSYDLLTGDNLISLFTNYMQKNLPDHSYALLKHDYTPWPYQVLIHGSFLDRVFPVLSDTADRYYAELKNNSSFIVDNITVFPVRNHSGRVCYVLCCSLTNPDDHDIFPALIGYIQQFFACPDRCDQAAGQRAHRQFAGYANNLTHDFNSLIAVVSTLNIDNPFLPKKLEYGKRLSREFISYLREAEPVKTLVRLNDLIEAVLELQASPTAVTRQTDPDHAQIRIAVDLELISKAIGEILDNAVYFANLVQGKVSLLTGVRSSGSIFIDRDWVSLTVKSEGPQIPEEFLSRVKAPFFTTLKDQGKPGLGLATAEKIVRAHAGCLTVENCQPRGVQTVIYLPMEKTDACE